MPRPTSTLKSRGDVFCSYCGQGFKRDEHLERHILTHINVRPFRCPECRLGFKRKDLLRRHYQSIHVPPPEHGEPVPTRSETVDRIPIACMNCAQSKTKCDKQVPCGRCVKREVPCERRQFRRNSWKGNPKRGVRPANAGKTPDEKPIEEAQEFEVHIVPEKPVESGLEVSCHPSTSIALAAMHISNQDTIDEPFKSPAALEHSEDTGLKFSTITVANMLGHNTDTLDMGAQIADDSELSVGIEGSLFTELHMSSDHNTHFDIPMDDGYFDDILADTYLMCASPDKTVSDSEWSLCQNELRAMSYTSTKPSPGGELHGAWPLFDCNPKTGELSKTTTKTNVSNLKVLENPAIWSICAPSSSALVHMLLEETSSGIHPFHASKRDQLLAVTQHVWRMSRERVYSTWSADQQSVEAHAWMDKVILLPPTDVLHHFLTRYVYQENERFHLFPAQDLLISVSLLQSKTKVMSGILTLLLIAQNTRSVNVSEGRDLSNGLVEVCRTVVQDAVDTDSEVPINAEFLETSLCLLQLMQWSGEPRHMTAVLDTWEQHSKARTFLIIHKGFPQKDIHSRHIAVPVDRQFSALGTAFQVSVDAQSRMFYSWLAVDLELSLFHDIPPKLEADTTAFDLPAINNNSPIMFMDDWNSSTAMPLGGSLVQFEKNYTSLMSLFTVFKESQLSGCHDSFSVTSLRLLLHPLQSLSTRLHQCLDTFSSMQCPGRAPNSTMGLASKAFMDEVGTLLERWRRLFASTVAMTGNSCPKLRESLALYHIMVLNNLTSFPRVERLIRERTETFRPNDSPQSWMRTASSEGMALLLFNCGQCLQVLRTMPAMTRPLWWAAVLYRVALILGQAIISNNATSSTATLKFHTILEDAQSPNSTVVTLDREYAQHTQDQDIALQRFLGRMQGTPVMTKPDGSAMVLSSETKILDYCISMLDGHLVFESSSFANGIRLKLWLLRSRWRYGNSYGS
ncbi:hypothetical protein K504DRAFT_498142 [Pleomassaria siparia CBS 279.74]|uniref:Uncharacterized protein n=1 Tax=Pleomassaria siparia CBS 279.74 TaxID=1314801 RepID=A0A6G1KLU3_9PLEO|nr:hypothetical protein K504DRAFT_498142 [Pleomassaria siparia CBS 279.74]